MAPTPEILLCPPPHASQSVIVSVVSTPIFIPAVDTTTHHAYTMAVTGTQVSRTTPRVIFYSLLSIILLWLLIPAVNGQTYNHADEEDLTRETRRNEVAFPMGIVRMARAGVNNVGEFFCFVINCFVVVVLVSLVN